MIGSLEQFRGKLAQICDTQILIKGNLTLNDIVNKYRLDIVVDIIDLIHLEIILGYTVWFFKSIYSIKYLKVNPYNLSESISDSNIL